MRTQRWNRFGGLVAVGLLVAGCETGTEPDLTTDFDAQAAIADYEAMEGVMETTGWASFQALGGRTPFGGATGVAVVGQLRAPVDGDDARAFALELVGRVQAAEAISAAPIISDHHRGMTFVYDPGLDRYVPDPERTGAPATGVRFILYAVDGAGTPLIEQETGHADLVDEGDSSAEDIVLHLTVVEGPVVILDYRTSVDGDEGQGALTVEGFVQGDGARLDFAIEAAGSRVGDRSSLDVLFEMRVDARDFSINGSVRGVEEATMGEGHVELTVRHGSESIRVDVQGSDGQIDGTFYLNGQVFATVSGDADDPTFLGASGEPLTGAEFLVLRHILDVVVEDVFDFLECLLDPVDELVILAIIL